MAAHEPEPEEWPLASSRADLPPAGNAEAPELRPLRFRANLILFAATVVSVFFTGAGMIEAPVEPGVLGALRALARGWPFAIPLLTILVSHELGHFIAARIHRVDASLPYFIPAPLLSPFGTMGAVIAMKGRIRSRKALLDIGAAGPLAGLVVAIPVLVYGIAHSPVHPYAVHGIQEGQCLLYWAVKRVVLGPIPAGHDVFLSPTAEAGWAGLFVTMLNLVTVAQLDGGHIAYALFGERQNRFARYVHRGLLVFFVYNLVTFVGPVVLRRQWGALGEAFGNSFFWLAWFGIIHLIRRVGGRDHPPTEPGELGSGRTAIAILSLVLFVLLFMPTPWATY